MKKGYKVTDVKREKKIGVAAQNLEEFIEKSCKKLGFNVSCAVCRLCVAEDGTQVDDDEYLATLPSQTLFILLKNTEKMVTDFDYYYDLIRSQKKDYIDTGAAAKEFLSTNIKEKFKVFQKYIAAANDARTMLSERTQDPGWFDGLEPSEKTKEQSMSKRVKDRMRGYYYKTKSALQSSDVYIHSKNGRGKKLIDQFLTDLRNILESYKYNETYFNRKANKNARICDESGLFQCGGLWSSDKCLYKGEHVINPYRSREERIIFQTWNLDHKIELSRSIIPKILQAIDGLYSGDIKCILCDKDSKVGGIEADRYYLQIFTRENLKLVHIVCHYKGKHDAESGVYTLCKKCYGDTNVETSRFTDCTELLGTEEGHHAGNSLLRTMVRTPDTNDVLTPYNMSPPMTRSSRRLSTQSEGQEPARKKPKNSEGMDKDHIRAEFEKIHETQSSVLKLIKDLNVKLDCVKTLVATKISGMETNISTVNARDGLLASRGPPASTARLTGTTHHVQVQNRKFN